MGLEEFKNYVDKNIMSIMSKSNEEERDLLNVMIKIINQLCEKEQELITYLKEEIEECYRSGDCRPLKTLQEILSKLEKSDK